MCPYKLALLLLMRAQWLSGPATAMQVWEAVWLSLEELLQEPAVRCLSVLAVVMQELVDNLRYLAETGLLLVAACNSQVVLRSQDRVEK
jgi:hypothetical protein